MVEKKCFPMFCQNCQFFGCTPRLKKDHSTEMCIYVLKEMIEFYKSCNTSVFVTFLDASKAYDKIDHWLLYDKLLHNDVTVLIVKILVYWYSHQEMLYGGVTLAQTYFMSRMESNRVVYCLRLCLMCV